MSKAGQNEEVQDLLTQQAGATNLHNTRHTNKTVSIEEPTKPTTGATGYTPTIINKQYEKR